ncbi:MAG: V8-like Glu-specific endopeptidase, partial [Myxococcota bacterium]
MPSKMLCLLPCLSLFATSCLGQRGLTEKHYSSEIIGGDVERGYPGVGALIEDGRPVCTASLVSTTVAVTAAHCLDGVPVSDITFFVGPDASRPSTGERYAVRGAHIHPDYDADEFINDVGVIVVDEVSDAEPVAYLTDDMGSEWIGREPLFIGYGYSPEDGYGIKRSVRIPITAIYDDAFEYEGDGINTCSGDSGGPALYTIDGTPTLIGVTSYGDEDCEIYGVNARIDPFSGFIYGFLDTDTDDTSATTTGDDVFGIADASAEGRAILYLTNELDFSELDDDVGLDRRAATNIIAWRSGDDGVLNTGDDEVFDTLESLDAIAYVGERALGRLLDYADATGVLDAFGTVHGVEEGSDEAAAILWLASTLSETALDITVALDRRAAENIV